MLDLGFANLVVRLEKLEQTVHDVVDRVNEGGRDRRWDRRWCRNGTCVRDY